MKKATDKNGNNLPPVNIIDYARKNMDTFSMSPFNEVDGFIFANLSSLILDRILGDFSISSKWVQITTLNRAEEYDYMTNATLSTSEFVELVAALSASPRFRDVLVNYFERKYDEKEEEQFCSVSFRLPTGELVVSYSGTDITLVGWKENFNMLFLSPVPAQISAVEYLTAVAKKTKGDIFVVGYSKGGNLAVYAASNASKKLQNRIRITYNYDGPGLKKDMINEGYSNIKEKIIKLMPSGSMVGAIFEEEKRLNIIKSNQIGFLQHISFSWLVTGNKFEREPSISPQVLAVDEAITRWMNELDFDQRKSCIDTFFDIFVSTGAKTVNDLIKLPPKELIRTVKSIRAVDEKTTTVVVDMFKKIIKETVIPKIK